ncbi:hypothetical protein PM082_020380 [Marasmius tenuissimus]|nr:hypothetical protein PM082_020380 [Marasmius tenuissimus]
MERSAVIHNQNIGSGVQINNSGAGTQSINFINSYNTATTNPLKTLWDSVAGVGASHTAEQQYERGECLEGTREEVLRVIFEWIALKNLTLPICWLSGPTGVGKSAIAMTVAKSCEGQGLTASFFCFRSDPKRNNPSALVLTVAHGLVVNMPFAKTSINQRVSDDPSILEARLEDQFRELVLKPSLRGKWWRRALAKLSPGFKDPDLVIIDGLDECGDELTQQRILSAILSSYQQSPCSPLRFLICSRPEAWIREAFKAVDLSRITERVVLDDKFLPDKDIKRYYLHEFQLIRTDPKYARVHFPDPWPSPEDLECLVEKSSGQFVYAATTVRFIKLAYPIRQLRIVLDYTPENSSSEASFSTIDGLYHVIISLSPDHSQLLSILASILILPPHLTPSPEIIELLLGLAAGEVDLALRFMHSVLNIGAGNEAITAYHTSFTDFLCDPSRSGRFHVDRVYFHNVLACQWLRTLVHQVKANPNLVLGPSLIRRTSNVCHMLETWDSFCFTDRQPAEELLIEGDNLLRTILSTFPDREELFTTLASIILLPIRTPDLSQPRFIHDLILGPDTQSIRSRVIESLEACQLIRPAPRLELAPFFVRFLSDPLQEYHLNLQRYRDPLARQWVQTLVQINQPPVNPDLGARVLWHGWADFCCRIERPSDGLLSDLENLDLMTVAISMALVRSNHEQSPPIATSPLEVLIPWLTRVDNPFAAKLLDRFREALEWHRAKSEEIPAECQPAKSPYYELDCIYHIILRNANPDHDKVRLILAAVVVLPGYLEPSPAHIELLFGLPSEETYLTLRAMRSVLTVRGSGDAICLFHATVREFLVDNTRSRDFHVDINTQKHAIARQWLQQLTSSNVRTYSFNQLYSKKTKHFFTEWIQLCSSIPIPTRGLLDDLQNVDLASTFLLVRRFPWEGTFRTSVMWVKQYDKHEIGDHTRAGENSYHKNRGYLHRLPALRRTFYGNGEDEVEVRGRNDSVALVAGLVHKLENRPRCFHLEWSPGVSPPDDDVYWVVNFTTECSRPTRLNGSPSNMPRLTDCRCDLSGGKESGDPGHLAYQEACMRLAKAFVSLFEELSKSGVKGEVELRCTFLNMVQSSLLSHCHLDTGLLSLCRTFFGLANGCLSMQVHTSEGEKGRANMFRWIETFQNEFNEEGETLKAQVLNLPWEQWSRNLYAENLYTGEVFTPREETRSLENYALDTRERSRNPGLRSRISLLEDEGSGL